MCIANCYLKYMKEKAITFEMWQTLSENFEQKRAANQFKENAFNYVLCFNRDTITSHFLKFD